MLTRAVLTMLAAAAVTAGGSLAAVRVSGVANDTALTQRAPRAAEAQAGQADAARDPRVARDQGGAEREAAEAPPCAADAENHGSYVSSVARTGAGGATVSAAAKSGCGKPAKTEKAAKTAKAERDAAKAARRAAKTAEKTARAERGAGGGTGKGRAPAR